MSSKGGIIPREALDGWSRWHPGELFAPQPARAPEPPPEPVVVPVEEVAAELLEDDAPHDPPPAYPTAAELEAIHHEAWEGGHEAGRADGMAQGLVEGREAGFAAAREEAAAAFAERFAPLAELGQRFEAELSRLEAELAPAVLKLAFELATELTRVTVESRPESLRTLLAEALADWREDLGRARVRVHPDDLATVRDFLETEAPATVWQWQADETLARGGCVIDTKTVSFDLSLETRRAALAAALGLGEAGAGDA